MDILLLGGQSPRHLEWSRALAEALESHGHHVARLVYANWLAGTRVIDIEAEVSAAAELAGPLDRPVVVAKSIGTVIATLAIGRRLIQPAGEVFLGLPLEAFENDPEAVGYLPNGVRRVARDGTWVTSNDYLLTPDALVRGPELTVTGVDPLRRLIGLD